MNGLLDETIAAVGRAQGKGGGRVERPMHDMLLAAAGRLSLHMPGAQGRPPFGPMEPYRLETTELPVTDDLYAPAGAVARAEALAAASAGAAHTLMLAGGSTAGMHAMLLYAAGGGGAVILPRNVHASAIHLCAVAGLEPVFARPAFTASELCYTPEQSYLEALERHPHARAMLVTRPDYYGALHWPQSAVARAKALGMLVLCDEAHGAHLNWDAHTPTAGDLGADLWVQSAHKTLPALNAGAWLHAGPGVDARLLRARLRMVQTSSPSFVGLMALDDARAWMDGHGAQAVAQLTAAAARFHARAAALGYGDGQCEPGWAYDRTRLVIGAPQGGFALAQALAQRGIDVEMSDARRVVCILSLMDGPERLKRLLAALEQLPPAPCAAQAVPMPPTELPPRDAPLKQAAFAPAQAVPIAQAAGRVSAVTAGLYPPGTPLITPGERITPALAAYLNAMDGSRLFGLGPDATIDCIR